MGFPIASSSQTIGIVGWLGRMGKWFVKYFSKKRKPLLLYDIRSGRQYRHSCVTVCKSLDECVALSDIVIICVPLDETPAMIRKCASLMRNDASLIEISSIKYNTFRTLKKIKRRINLMSIHPMFGPGSVKRDTQKILMIPVKNKKRELNTLRDLFADIKTIIIKNWRTHDKYMSVLLSLVYYLNILFARTLTGQDISTLKSLTGTSFAVQSLLSESMLTDEPSLISSLFIENPFAIDLVRKYNFQATIFTRYITNHDNTKIKSLIRNTKTALGGSIDFGTSYSKLYDIFTAIASERYGKLVRD